MSDKQPNQAMGGAADEGGSGGFFGHGGQSHIAYSGTGDDDGEHNDNAATGAD